MIQLLLPFVSHDAAGVGCQMMPFASVSPNVYSIINGTIIFLDQDDRSDMQHDFLGHMMLLAPASAAHDIDSIVNSIITFLISR